MRIQSVAQDNTEIRKQNARGVTHGELLHRLHTVTECLSIQWLLGGVNPSSCPILNPPSFTYRQYILSFQFCPLSWAPDSHNYQFDSSSWKTHRTLKLKRSPNEPGHLPLLQCPRTGCSSRRPACHLDSFSWLPTLSKFCFLSHS